MIKYNVGLVKSKLIRNEVWIDEYLLKFLKTHELRLAWFHLNLTVLIVNQFYIGLVAFKYHVALFIP